MSIFGRTNITKYDPSQPRDATGKWTDDGGISSLGTRGSRGYEFVSPNEGSETFAGAVSSLDSSRQQALLAASRNVDRVAGIDGTDRSIIGAWSDGAENSIMTTVNDSDYGKLKLAAAMKAHLANQKQALVFQEDKAGPAKLLSFDATGDLHVIHDTLINDGVAFHTLVPTEDGKGAKVYVVDMDGSAIPHVIQAANTFKSEVSYQSGHAEFIGTQKEDGSDHEQRQDARRTYEDIIGESSVQGATAKWQGVHNRWGSTLQADRYPDAGTDSGSASGGGRGVPGVREAQARAAEAADGKVALIGLPQTPLKVGRDYYVPGPIGAIRDVAESYMKSAGMPYSPPRDYRKVDPMRAKRIASEYDAMKDDPDDPATKASYAALAKETIAQWHAAKASGLKVEWIKAGQADPYGKSLRLAAIDVAEHNHLWAFPTDLGFGQGEAINNKNPLLADSGETIGGRKCLVNDVFRVVHDYFGHFKEGNGFRADGEDNAWRSHAAMYSKAAIPAMTSETRGQNSWVNFGPYAEHNKHATPGDTHYAPQKIGIMPEWTSIEGR